MNLATMTREEPKCGVCDKPLGKGENLCGEHWYTLSHRGFPITERKIKALRLELQQDAADARKDSLEDR